MNVKLIVVILFNKFNVHLGLDFICLLTIQYIMKPLTCMLRVRLAIIIRQGVQKLYGMGKLDQAQIKKQNRNNVIRTIWGNSPLSRTNLASMTGLNKATITNIINELIYEGLVIEVGSVKGSVGRSQSLLAIDVNAYLCAGIVFRPSRIKVALSDIHANIVWRRVIPFDGTENQNELFDKIFSALDDGLASCSDTARKLLGIGVGTASLLRPEDDMLYAIHSINWYNVPLVTSLRHYYNVPVIADTVANNCMLAEKVFGIAHDAKNAIFLAVGYGIGGGILIGDKLYRGSNGFAGDLGHFVIDPNGPLCPCGKRGCWELLASSIYAGESFASLYAKAEAGDKDSISKLTNIGRNLGIGIANLVSIVNPEIVIIGGSSVNAGKWILNPCRNEVKSRVFSWVESQTRIEFKSLGDDCDIIGSLSRSIELLFT